MPEIPNSRNRSASLEHATLMDDQQQRKRPRLDSAEAGITEASLTLKETAANIKTDSIPPLSPNNPSTSLNMATSPTSKVTINTRSAPSSTQPASNNTTASEQHINPKEDDAAMIPGPSPGIAQDDAISISSSSSAAKSPEIQVAEVEDFDQDESETRWQPIGSTSKPRLGPYFIHETFPHARLQGHLGRVGRILPEMSQVLQKDDCGTLLLELQEWISHLAELREQITPEFMAFEPVFWTDLPDLITCLLRREKPISGKLIPSLLLDFFVDYGLLVTRLLELDLDRLRRYASGATDITSLMSQRYLDTMVWSLQATEIPLYDALLAAKTLKASDLTSSIIEKLAKERAPNLLHHMITLGSELKMVLPKKPGLWNILSSIVLLGLQFFVSKPADDTMDPTEKPSGLAIHDEIAGLCHNLFTIADDVLQHGIMKQQSWLNIENMPELMRALNKVYVNPGIYAPILCAELMTSSGIVSQTFTPSQTQNLMSYVWKMKTLRKLIVNGRMELRVWGCAEMQIELVQVYKSNVQSKPLQVTSIDPLVRFLVAFIRDTRLVEYIIGVDSHPQLISRSASIVGFLSVTNTYSDADTDMMWHTVTESEDPRIVKEVLKVMTETAGLSNPPTLFYFCSTLLNLPIDRYNDQFVDYAAEILDKILQKLSSLAHFEDDIRPLQLCTHLYKIAGAPGACSTELSQRIRELTYQRFHLLLSSCGGLEARQHLWSECIADITVDNAFATGSIEAIRTWSEWADRNGQELEINEDLMQVLVKNIVHFTASCGEEDGNNTALQTSFEIRLSMLARLIMTQSTTLESELLNLLWEGVFTSPSLPSFVYLISWNTLTSIIKWCGTRPNFVIDGLIQGYLAKLQPSDYNESCLLFLEQVMEREMQQLKEKLANVDVILNLPGEERIRNVMLDAPANTIESDAADFIITKYLDHGIITSRSAANIKATHMALVNRCVGEVIKAASVFKLHAAKEPGACDDPEELQNAETRFYRWLLFLRKFLEGMKVRPSYSPKSKQSPLPIGELEVKGEAMESTYQVYKSRHLDQNKMRKVVLGRQNTGSELWRYLADASGFEVFRTLIGGRDMELKNVDKTLDELRFKPGNIIVIRHEGSPDHNPYQAARASSPVDSTVMDNFGALYELLNLENRFAKEIFGFLSLFPAQSSVVDGIRSRQLSPDELLPIENPYRLLYCAQAFRACLETESFSTTPDHELLRYGIKTIINVLPRVYQSPIEGELQCSITKSLFESLLLALRASVPEDVSRSYFENPEAYVLKMLDMLEMAIISTGNPSQTPIFEPFDALLEGALHDDRLWPFIIANPKTPVLMRNILLTDRREHQRKQFSKFLLQLSGLSVGKISLKVNDPRAARSRFPAEKIETALSHLWSLLVGELPSAEQFPFQSQELFGSATAIFRRVSKGLAVEVLLDLFRRWSTMLISHQYLEVVGRSSDDFVVPGLTKLLHECCKVLRTKNVDFETEDLSSMVLAKFLLPFPKADDSRETIGMPVLNGSLRAELYDLILLLNQKPESLSRVVESLVDTVQADVFNGNEYHDRLSVRSAVGYAGLRNLSNTCYLNSLFSQLFMNMRFRDLIVHAGLFDKIKQPLLVELGRVFSRMQDSFRKAIPPLLVAECIVNYENDPIDVAIQMDVDEFYNLLFDRLEWQFLDPAERRTFKSLYGGQLVQQIKSRDCTHISEVFEDFTTVQLEIKGRRCLEDSLKSYVEGEILQGDNKYKCSQCDRHVDAVKRACLKQIPNNLIFNLKRFDYDIMTGTRAKVNDEFEFPESIDMTPYTMDGLSDDITKPDIFELVGVIVHTGTADSGHYYSFIRQRPSSKHKTHSWVQFNDSDVSVFDVDTMAENCFGGFTEFNFPKIYNAYMLFYERSSSIQQLENDLPDSDPPTIALLSDIEAEIEVDNQHFVQSYCLQDPSHARFLHSLLCRVLPDETGKCSDGHQIETNLLTQCLDYIQQFSSRWKEQPEVDVSLRKITQCVDRCTSCAYVVVKWYIDRDALRDRILRSPYSNSRVFFKILLYRSISSLRPWYTSTPDRETELAWSGADETTPHQLFQDLVERFGRQWDVVPRYARAWDDYFELLSFLVQLGSFELLKFLEDGLLERILEIVLAHTGLARPSIKDQMKVFLAIRDKGRHFSLHHLLELLGHMLNEIEIATISDGARQILPSGKLDVNSFEAHLLGTHPDSHSKPRLEWMTKAIVGKQNPSAVTRMVARLASAKETSGLIYVVIVEGINDQEVSIATLFFRSVLAFCQNCQEATRVREMVSKALHAVHSIGTQYNREHLNFVTQMFKLENPHLEMSPLDFRELILRLSGKWAPPLLLSPPKYQNVSNDTCELLSNQLWAVLHAPEHVDQHDDVVMNIRRLTVGCYRYIQENILVNTRDRRSLQPKQTDNICRILEAGARDSMNSDTAHDEQHLANVHDVLTALMAKQEAANQAAAESMGSPDWAEGTSDSDALEALSDAEISGMMTPSPGGNVV